MSRFVLTAQLQLQAPRNARQIVQQIRNQLSGVTVNVGLRNAPQTQRQLTQINNQVRQVNQSGQRLGRTFGLAVNRFAAFTVATRAVSLFTNGLANATKEAIAFEREMVKISQVTGKTLEQLSGLSNTITNLSVSLGTSSKDLLSTSRILAQTGLQARDLEVALSTLAKTTLAPTFDDITKTAEGAVAILAQFGQGVGALEQQLGAINAVAGQFAVESGDLISVVRRTGGVFKAAGGDLNELIALFTSVRATTRESAESIATGLRTIFTRIQRPKTIEYLKQFGVELTDLNGKFVGPYEAVRQLSQALSGLGEGDIRFVQIAEELGGFRQIGKVIPLLQQFETAEKARQAALEGGDSLTKDAATAQQALAVQITKVKEEFLALVRGISQTGSFQTLVKTSLDLASALISIADALKPLLPLLGAFAAFKLASGAIGFGRGFGAAIRGGGPRGFARGGMVPGTGNRDTVPAMLTPGEFVIRKSSVNKLGAGTLAAMNENGYAAGGVVTSGRNFYGNILPVGGAKLRPELQKLSGTTPASTAAGTKFTDAKGSKRILTILDKAITAKADVDDFGAAFLRPFGSNVSLKGTTDPATVKQEGQKLITQITNLGIPLKGRQSSDPGKVALRTGITGILDKYNKKNKFNLDAGSLQKTQANSLEETLLSGIEKTIIDGAKQLNTKLKVVGTVDTARLLKSANVDQTLGNLFEGVLSYAGAPYGEKDSDAPNAPFDFFKGVGASLARLFGLTRVANRPTEAKSTFASKNIASISKKVENTNASEMRKEVQEAFLQVAPQLRDFATADISQLFGAKNQAGLAKAVPSAVFSKVGQQSRVAFRNSGGGISGSDTVPAMLTPGEFVFNKDAAKNIGYSNLNRMNKQGVKGFNKGGAVGVQYFATGGTPSKAPAMPLAGSPALLNNSLAQLGNAVVVAGELGAKRIREGLQNTGKTLETAKDGVKKKFDDVNKMLDKQNKSGEQKLRNLFEGIDKKTRPFQQKFEQNVYQPMTKWPGKVQEVFNKLRGVKAPANQAATPVAIKAPPVAGAAVASQAPLLSSTSNIKLKAGGIQNLETNLQRLSAHLKSLGVSSEQTSQITKRFSAAVLAGGSNVQALTAGFSKTGVSVKQLEASSMKAAKADDMEAAASKRAATGGGVVGGKGGPAAAGAVAGGGGGMMGALFAASMLPTLIPQVEGATEGLGAMQNKLGETAMGLTTLAFVVSALPAKMQGFAGALVGTAGAVYAFATLMDAYTGVHMKAKEAVEKGLVAEAGTRSVDSRRQSDANVFAGIVAAVGAVVAAVVAVIAGLPVAIVAAVGGVAAGLLGLVGKTEMLDDAFTGMRDWLASFTALDSTKQIKERAEAEAALKKVELEAAENTKKASEAMKEVEGGARSLRDVISSGDLTGNIRNRQNAIAEQQDLVRADAESGDQDAYISSLRELIESQKALREEQLKNLPILIKASREQFIAGQTLSDFRKTASEVFGQDFNSLDPEIQAKAYRAYANNIKAIAENTAAFAASTMGLRFIRNAADGLNAVFDRTSSVLSGSFNSLSSSVDIVGAAMSGADIDPSLFERSLREVNSTLSSFGVSSKVIDKMNNTFSALRTASAGFNDALEKTRDETLKEGLSGQDVKERLIKNLTDLPGLDEEGKRVISALFGNLELSSEEIAQLQAGNFDAILSKLDEAGSKAFEETQAATKALATAQDKLLKITKQRADAELKMIKAQKKAIGLQEESAEIIAKANGKQLTTQEKLSFANQRLAADLRGGAGSDGSTSGIMARIGQIQGGAAAATARLSNVAGGAEGDTFDVANDQQTLSDANRELDALAEYARKRVKLYEEELKIVQKKNELEKSSLEKLISGDITGFVEEQSAAAAQVALRSGNKTLTNLFSSQSLGKAFAGLEDQGLSDAEKRAAASVALGPGFNTDRNIGVLTGTTDEEKRIRAGMAEQGEILGALAPAVEQVGSSDFQIASAGLRNATDEYVNAQARAAAASQKFAEIMERAEQAAADQQARAERDGARAEAAAERAEKQAEKKRADEDKVMRTEVDKMEIYKTGNIIFNTTDEETGKKQKEVVIASEMVGPDAPRTQNKSMGGMIYASRGMFIPRGTDTVPAMLTPGEFVVNRAAVRRGNNLQILQSMNSGDGGRQSGPVATMSKGGTVYRSNGSTGPEAGGIDMAAVFKTFESSSKMFSDAVNKLVGFKLNVQLDPTNVNVNLNGGTFLQGMKDDIKKEILDIVSDRIRSAKFDFTGDINIDPFTQSLS